MNFTLDSVVPWGRSFDEYVAMFALDAADLSGSILGCADGPACCNAEYARQGGRVVPVEPIYAFTQAEIAARIQTVNPTVHAQLTANAADYVWNAIATPEALAPFACGP